MRYKQIELSEQEIAFINAFKHEDEDINDYRDPCDWIEFPVRMLCGILDRYHKNLDTIVKRDGC